MVFGAGMGMGAAAGSLGHWGMVELIEPRLRALVAENLGVSEQELALPVSLTDDLAADSLDLVELCVTVEGAFGIDVPEQTIDEVRTYGDLVAAVVALVEQQALESAGGLDAEGPPVVASRVVPASAGAHVLERAGRLTPYAAETIADDVRRAGAGGRLELWVATPVSDVGLDRIREHFAWARMRGVELRVGRAARVVQAAS
jgi:acyl carrier protein